MILSSLFFIFFYGFIQIVYQVQKKNIIPRKVYPLCLLSESYAALGLQNLNENELREQLNYILYIFCKNIETIKNSYSNQEEEDEMESSLWHLSRKSAMITRAL